MYRSDKPNFATFAAAARAGNPDNVVTFNPGIVHRILSVTPHEDYTAGEIDKPELMSIRRAVDGKMDGAQIHVLSYLGETWGKGTPRFSDSQVIEWSRSVINAGGAVTWDVPVQPGGSISESFLSQLRAVGQAIAKR